MGGDGGLARGREAAGRLAWADAYAALSLADQSSSLAVEDLELLGTAAYLLGHVEDCLGALQRAQQLHAEAGESRGAARCAFWLAFHLGNRGELAQAGGWLARANRLLEHEPQDCAERGLLLLSLAVQQIVADDNGAVFFPIELPAFAAFVPDPECMRASGVPLTVAVGTENRDTWYGAAAAWLAEGTGAELVELPGGHGGFVSHPQAFMSWCDVSSADLLVGGAASRCSVRPCRSSAAGWNVGEAARWGFINRARMRARPAGPAESSALHDFDRSGPTKEAHRRALNRSGGLLHSEAGRASQGQVRAQGMINEASKVIAGRTAHTL